MSAKPDPAAHPLCARYGYTLDHNRVGNVWSYTRPDGDEDDEEFPDAATAWDAAESDARLWDDDHGEGFRAVETLAAVRAVLETVNGNSEPDVMEHGFYRLAVVLNGEPDPGPYQSDDEEEA